MKILYPECKNPKTIGESIFQVTIEFLAGFFIKSMPSGISLLCKQNWTCITTWKFITTTKMCGMASSCTLFEIKFVIWQGHFLFLFIVRLGVLVNIYLIFYTLYNFIEVTTLLRKIDIEKRVRYRIIKTTNIWVEKNVTKKFESILIEQS